MACKIAITSVDIYGSPGQPVSSVEVKGASTECASVEVRITCDGLEQIHQAGFVNPQGDWQTTFANLNDPHCLCGDPNVSLVVFAYCKTDPTCSDRVVVKPIDCQPPEKDCCPTVSIEVTEGACDAQGRRNVTFKVTTTPASSAGCPDTVFAQLDFGDGMLGAGFVVPPDSVWIESHPYVPGSYTAKVHIIAPLGCPDIPVKVGPLAECPPGCPDPDDITVAVDDCDAEGRRIVSVNVLLPGSGSTTVSVDWQDGTPPDSNLPIQGGVLWTGWHHYLPPGPYKVTVSVAGCPPITKPVGPLARCNDRNDNGHHPCPWWNPFCKGWSFCAALLALAEASILTAFVLFFLAGCIVLTPDVLAGGYTAIVHALLAAAIFKEALVAAAAGLVFLTLWYLFCSKFKADFCDTLYSVKTALAWFIAVLAVLTGYLVIAQDWGCLIGLAVTFVYWGTVLAYLNLIYQWAGCHH